VHEPAAAEVDADVAEVFEEDQVPRLELGERDVQAGVVLVAGDPG